MDKKYCCLIVTFNRKDLLCRCIDHCLMQDVIPDIFIFDNSSTDNTRELLNEKQYLSNSRITYFYNAQNLGGAGGFSNGLKMCIEKGYDFIWMMDDDGYPRKTTSLSECISAYFDLNKNAIINAMVYAEDNYLSFKIDGCETLDEIKNKYASKNIILNSIAPFNGTLISSSIAKKIGYPRADFFIKGDEFEYVTRAKLKGIVLATAKKADFYHPRFTVQKKKFLFKKITVNDEPAWKEYCRARNYTYIYKTYYGRKALIRHYFVEIVRCLFYTNNKMYKTKATIQGIVDGNKNIFSNDNVIKYRD